MPALFVWILVRVAAGFSVPWEFELSSGLEPPNELQLRRWILWAAWSGWWIQPVLAVPEELLLHWW
jgi:hypothetical protein